MSGYGAFSDDFYLNMNLSTEMELAAESRVGFALF